MGGGMSQVRKRILNRIADGFLALQELDQKEGSPDPLLTALAGGLCVALSLVRVTLAHSGGNDSFEEVISMAREMEEESWKQHRGGCERCGVQ